MLLVGVGAGIVVVLLNVFVIGCCLHKRNEKRLKRGTGKGHKSERSPAVAAAACTRRKITGNWSGSWGIFLANGKIFSII